MIVVKLGFGLIETIGSAQSIGLSNLLIFAYMPG